MANGFFGFPMTTWQDWPMTDRRSCHGREHLLKHCREYFVEQAADQGAWGEQGCSRRISTAYAEFKGESKQPLPAKNSPSALPYEK
jgi:hypothetical protein